MAAVALTTTGEESLWYWIKERHEIFLRRQRGEPKPWTQDPILQTYKFTNPFRENDTGTVWLRENFLEPHRLSDADFEALEESKQWDLLSDIAFNICWYRMFNWIGTGELLGWRSYSIQGDQAWDVQDITDTLTLAYMAGTKIFTGAHMVRSPFGEPKIDSIVQVCSELEHMCYTAYALVTCCREEKSLQAVFNALLQVSYVGPFMAYEMVTDMRHTRLLEDARDIMTWANAGPGAMRGLERLSLPWKRPEEAVESMRGLLARSEAGLQAAGAAYPGPDWPIVEMRDIEHSLCEFDKYSRVKFGEGRPRGKYNGLL